ncbi:MAG: hypothetical protein IKU51_01740 [Clostridia bacterium]|nr:hypothetical protein [Clostridia bacterium]
MKKAIVLCLVCTMLLCLVSCGSEARPESGYMADGTLQYETVYAPDSVQGYWSDIAIVGNRLYYCWYDDGKSEAELFDVIDMVQKGTWQRVTNEEEKEIAKSNIGSIHNYYPMYEEIGKFILFSDADNNVYLLDTETGNQTDLHLNYEDWRRFATDHESYFAVLSACTITVDGEFVNEIRYYKLDQN